MRDDGVGVGHIHAMFDWARCIKITPPGVDDRRALWQRESLVVGRRCWAERDATGQPRLDGVIILDGARVEPRCLAIYLDVS